VGSTWFAREWGNTIDTQSHGKSIEIKNIEKHGERKNPKKKTWQKEKMTKKKVNIEKAPKQGSQI